MTTPREACFSVEFTSELLTEEGQEMARGHLKLDSYKEDFYAYLISWTQDDYRLHWKRALEEVLSPVGRSALILSMANFSNDSTKELWPMWRVGDTVYFQNRVLFEKGLMQGFGPDCLASFVGERQESNEDGQRISEWQVDADCLKQFLNAQAHKAV